MGMPTIPPQPHRPCLHQTKIDLLESIALEEIALSHILNAEAEKVQAFVGDCLSFPTKPSNREIIALNQSVNQVVETVLMKEWLLLRKLQSVLEIDCPNCKNSVCNKKISYDPCSPSQSLKK